MDSKEIKGKITKIHKLLNQITGFVEEQPPPNRCPNCQDLQNLKPGTIIKVDSMIDPHCSKCGRGITTPTLNVGDWVKWDDMLLLIQQIRNEKYGVHSYDLTGRIIINDIKQLHPHTLTEEDLPDCPFCGEDLILMSHDKKAVFWIFCDDPDCVTLPDHKTEHNAISEALQLSIAMKRFRRDGV